MNNTDEKLRNRIKQEQEKRDQILALGSRTESNLLPISKAIDAYYCFHKLKLYCEYLSYEKIVGKKMLGYEASDFLLLEETLKISKSVFLKDNVVFKIYWDLKDLYENFETEQQNLFYKILNEINQSSQDMDSEEVLELFSYLSNYCIKKINNGAKQYLKNLLSINVKMVSNLYGLKGERTLPPGVFTNIVNNALRIKEASFFNSLNLENISPKDTFKGFKDNLEWTEKFIQEYTAVLEKNQQLLYHNYCKAILEFERNDFETAHYLLKQLERKRGIFINLDIKKIFIKTQFERFDVKQTRTNAYTELEKGLEAYRGVIKYERRKEKLNYQLDFHQVFYQFCQRLFNLYCKQSGIYFKNALYKQQKEQLRKDLETIEFPQKIWMIKKIDSLK